MHLPKKDSQVKQLADIRLISKNGERRPWNNSKQIGKDWQADRKASWQAAKKKNRQRDK